MKKYLFVFATILILSANVSWGQLPPNCKAYWSFDKVEGSDIKDESGLGNDARLVNNPTFEPGVVGNCMRLNGSNFATLYNEYFMDNSCNLTFASWIKLNENNPNKRCLIFCTSDAMRPTYDPISIQISNRIPNDMSFEDTQKGIAIRSHADFPEKFPVGKWFHLVVQLCSDENYSVFKIYVDGRLVKTVDMLSDMLNFKNIGTGKCCVVYDREMPSIIGALNSYPTWNFEGCLDEMMFFDRCLTDEEIIKISTGCKDIQDSIYIEAQYSNSINFDTTKVGKEKCINFRITNKTKEPYTLTNASLSSNSNFIFKTSLPLTIPASGSKNVEVCFKPVDDIEYKDVLRISNPCSSIDISLLGKGYGTCRKIDLVEIANEMNNNQIVIDSIKLFQKKCIPVDLVNNNNFDITVNKCYFLNNNFTIENLNLPFTIPKFLTFRIVVCVYSEKETSISDVLVLENECSKMLIPIRAVNNTCFDLNDYLTVTLNDTTQQRFDSTKVGNLNHTTFSIKNYTDKEVLLENAYFIYNLGFSYPHTQLPMLFSPFEEKQFELCYLPTRYGTEIDTFVIYNYCSSLRVPTISEGVNNDYSNSTKCDAILQMHGVKFKTKDIILSEPTPNPTSKGVKVSVFSKDQVLITFRAYNYMGDSKEALIMNCVDEDEIEIQEELLFDGLNYLVITFENERKVFIVYKK